jgi:hypothetical protein
MTLSDLLNMYTLTSCDFVRFSHEVKLATGFLITFWFFNGKNHVTLKMKLVVTCQLTFISSNFMFKLTFNKEIMHLFCEI